LNATVGGDECQQTLQKQESPGCIEHIGANWRVVTQICVECIDERVDDSKKRVLFLQRRLK
jgi:hypothetical protein